MEFEVDVQRQARTSVRPEQNRFPFCVCWSPLPPLTWICPLIGHMGIADSSGMIWDFAGPYHINRERMIFGSPTTYVQLDPSKCEGRSWDEAVHAANIIYGGGELDGKRYKGRMHNICCDNVMCFSSLPKSSEVRGEERRGEADGNDEWSCSLQCHSHVARALNEMRYKGSTYWNMFALAFWLVFRGQYVSFGAFLKTWGPFIFIVTFVMIVHFVFDP
uniref:Uncharacterized protein n=1 Tax=Pinguiococcus pyrenoidosus TaxID=172671 RepID=A0A7R9Y9S1_9STRA